MTTTITQEKIERIERLLYEIGGGKSWGYDSGNARRDAEYILTILAGDVLTPAIEACKSENPAAWIGVDNGVKQNVHLAFPDSPRDPKYQWAPLYLNDGSKAMRPKHDIRHSTTHHTDRDEP